ncbi:MAG: hypothetical protein ACYC46_14330 [Acidobacteriaceae bacterium]
MRLLMQLSELLPHLSRLVPMAERYFSGDRNALPPVMHDLQDNLENLHSSHESLVRQLHDQSVQLAAVEEELKRLRLSTLRTEELAEHLQKEVGSLRGWLQFVAGTMLLTLAGVLGILVHLFWHSHS